MNQLRMVNELIIDHGTREAIKRQNSSITKGVMVPFQVKKDVEKTFRDFCKKIDLYVKAVYVDMFHESMMIRAKIQCSQFDEIDYPDILQQMYIYASKKFNILEIAHMTRDFDDAIIIWFGARSE